MSTNTELANLIFPDIKETINDLEKKYPPWDLKEGAFVTKFANCFFRYWFIIALVSYKFAKQSDGVYFFRLEDTVQKREINGTGIDLVNKLVNLVLLLMKDILVKIMIKEIMGHINNLWEQIYIK